MIPENNKTANFFKFESLRIYHKAVDFANAIVALGNACQTEAQRYLAKHFANEALQIVTNIIDGAAQQKSDFVEYLQNAKLNIGKCVALCSIASKQRLIDETQETDIRTELMELTKMIGALITSFQKHDSVNTQESDA